MPTKHFVKNVEFLMTDNHVSVLNELLKEPVNAWLEMTLQPIVQTDTNGLIVFFRPSQKMSMSLVFFFQSLMIEQRLYLMDEFLKSNGVIS